MADKELSPALVTRLRRAIEQSDKSLNQLSVLCEQLGTRYGVKDTKMDRGRLSRFMRGERDLTVHAAGLLCEVLGLELREAKPDVKARSKRAK